MKQLLALLVIACIECSSSENNKLALVKKSSEKMSEELHFYRCLRQTYLPNSLKQIMSQPFGYIFISTRRVLLPILMCDTVG